MADPEPLNDSPDIDQLKMPSERIEPLREAARVCRIYAYDTSACPPTETLAGWADLLDQAADEIMRLRERLEEMSLAYINAANPGIDMEEVKRSRG